MRRGSADGGQIPFSAKPIKESGELSETSLKAQRVVF